MTVQDMDNDIGSDDSVTIKRILDDIGLPQYYDTFVGEGFTLIEDIKTLSRNDLKDDLNIKKLAHTKAIRKAFQDYSTYENSEFKLSPTIDIDSQLRSGDKYILIDIGGGTCDFACHKIEDNHAISELFHPSGGDW
eukprot:CAMPEP_0114658340 /NCGR_PEP_ID=MMETSP0191-20121206/15593_1 /TAXON_ID=126664 /ORGANISM="Sorites sp." /LENGTH=135 /DNA_ID=CAMNT_0001880151 /DNA_START=1265 /DNA_END=1669 /DNA_ORIENTATION=+